MSSKIKSIRAREILDSRGNPTVEVELETNDGFFIDSVPSGASTGKYEAKEIRDEGKRYNGKGVLSAVRNVNEVIGPKIIGENVLDQEKIDKIMIELDGSPNKSNLGANAILPISMAVCRAGAKSQKLLLYNYISKISGGKASVSLPWPCFNIINGGAHAGNELDIQEFMIIPQENSFSENLQIGTEIYHSLKNILKKHLGSYTTNIGDEGGFAPPISMTVQALSLIDKAIKNYPDVKIGLDCAATQFLKETRYFLDGTIFIKEGLLDFYQDLIKNYPIIFLEDPFAEEDFYCFQELTQEFGDKIIIVGDDLLTTNIGRIKKAKQENACNGIIIKPNQIGTITETLSAIKLAKSYNWKIIVSHRSGDTCDDFIADLAVGVSADFIKSGAPVRGERLSKYNRLLKIEQEITHHNQFR
ncbi:MAG: phosphopyruvate hydratase [Candidatus Nealsonbacteria bacterium]